MNRYNFTSEDFRHHHIMPNQLWAKKSYPHESVIILSYNGNNTFTCIPWVKQSENPSKEWVFAGGIGHMELHARYIQEHFQFLKDVSS